MLRTTYDRMTLAGPGERVTIDLGLSFGAAWLRPEWAIVETKSANGAGVADRGLRRLGSRPISMSKYLLGAGLTLMPTPPAGNGGGSTVKPRRCKPAGSAPSASRLSRSSMVSQSGHAWV